VRLVEPARVSDPALIFSVEMAVFTVVVDDENGDGARFHCPRC
jgi:hypothetical protein